MSALVLDTNVVSYLMKNDSRAEPYRAHILGLTPAVSFMTIGELYEWGYRRNWGAKRFAEFQEYLRNYVVIPYSAAICRHWGQLRAARRHQPISVGDAWIAATALTCGCPLVTHNPRDFRNIPGLNVITEHDT